MPAAATAYGWPLKPFHKQHPIRGGFGDPRYHVGAESQVSSFHFGVDIVARTGEAVYSVEPGFAHARASHVVVARASGRRFEYWHIRPVIRSSRYVRRHQLLGYVRPGWGHVHFAESFRGAYRDPLRRGALTPYYDPTTPVVSFVQLVGPAGEVVNDGRVTGMVNVVAGAYDTPPQPPRPPWQVARLAPAAIWWVLTGPDGLTETSVAVDFIDGLPINPLYPFVYAPGTYQNKPNRPGLYLFWLAHFLDTSAGPDGRYQLKVFAGDTRGNVGTQTLSFTTANGVSTRWAPPSPGHVDADVPQ